MVKYYDNRTDREKYPKAWCIIVWGGRSSGKTYSALRYQIEENRSFVFMKRTIKDVDMLCANGKRKGVDFDISPFKPLNRDFGWNYNPVPIIPGIAGFYHTHEDGEPYGKPVGYAAALSASRDIKGFDLSDADDMIFDEFIPKKFERISRGEGEQLLDVYMTVRRDRVIRGRDDLRLICLANATNVNNPTFAVLDLVDIAVQMDITDTEYTYLEDRGILLHRLTGDYNTEKEKSGIEKAMEGTAWADMAFGNRFSYDDFTSVQHRRLKGYRPVCSYDYKKKTTYIYEKDGFYYACRAKGRSPKHYNLERENDQKRFYYDFVSDLRDEVIEDRFTFSEFTMYDLIVNYKKIFQI